MLEQKENKPPKISVIIPVYNTDKYLENCLNSVTNQSLRDIEIICIDNNSTDNSFKILQKFAGEDKRIIILEESKKNVGVARNRGLKVARGEYIAFLDSDDFFELSALEEVYARALNTASDIVCYGAIKLDCVTTQSEKLITMICIPKEDIFSRNTFARYILGGFTFEAWSKIYKKDLIVKNNITFPEDVQRSEDLFFTYASLAKAERVSILQKNLVIHIVNRSDSMERTSYTYPVDFVRVILKLKAFLDEEDLYNAVEESFINSTIEAFKYNLEKNYSVRKIIYKYLVKMIAELHINDKQESYFYEELYTFVGKVRDIYNHRIILSRILYFFYPRVWRTKLWGISFLEYLFSSRNEGTHRVIRLFGLKIEIKSKRLIMQGQERTHLEYLFSSRNEDTHKVIRLLGLKIKIKSKRLTQRKELNQQRKELQLQLQLQLQEVYENINILKIKQSFSKNIVKIVKGDLFFYRQKRFDIIFKVLYVVSRNEFPSVHTFYEKLYLKHIQLWNNYFEEEPLKQSSADFLENFRDLIYSIEKYGFDEARPVLVGHNGCINNGSHRTATCFSLNKDIAVTLSEDVTKYDYAYFLENKMISADLADINALEYVKINPYAFIVSIFPVMPIGYDIFVESILLKYGFVYYKKCLDITYNGCFNLKKINYGCEEWVREHAEKSMGTRERGKQRVYVFVCHNKENLGKLKKEIRAILNIENFPIHINDERSEAIELAQTYFNKNSWYMLNKRPYSLISETLDLYINEFKSYIFSNNYKSDYFCAAGSTTLGVFGIRHIGDFDFLHIYEKISKPKNDKLSSDNGELKYYPFSKEEIILNPRNHFYYKGIKFISLEVLRMMKEVKNRDPKDINDVRAIKEYTRRIYSRIY